MGINMKDEEEVRQYLENLHIEYQFSCHKENSGQGCCLLGEYLQIVKEDYVKGAAAFKKGCDKHNFAKSCFLYGAGLFRGRGVKRDPAKALKYQSKACDLGWKDGCFAAGLQLSQDDSLRDIKAATEFFKRACDMGSGDGCFHVSGMYFAGTEPMEKDIRKAFDYSKRACAAGNIEACANVSWMYKTGHGVETNLAEAEKYRNKVLDFKKQFERNRGFEMEQGIEN